MLQKQKGTIIKLLKAQEAGKNYTDNYWFPYRDFLDPTDRFTDFSCENLAGKQPFITIIENLLHKDQTAEVFVQVYGLEEYAHDEPVIYADTLILFSRLPLSEIKQIFNEPGDTVRAYNGSFCTCRYFYGNIFQNRTARCVTKLHMAQFNSPWGNLSGMASSLSAGSGCSSSISKIRPGRAIPLKFVGGTPLLFSVIFYVKLMTRNFFETENYNSTFSILH